MTVTYSRSMTPSSSTAAAPQLDTSRGERTRSAILDASRRLFLERGYAGTPINAITEACGISRAGFYTYFKDKREIFNVLGKTAYHDALAVIAEWAEAPEPLGPADIRVWVGHYFDYMDQHGAFVLASAHSAPDDDEFRNSRNRMVTRASWKLGQAIAGGGGVHSPDVVGVAVMGLLDRAWHTVHRQTVAVDRSEMIAVVAEMIVAMTRR
ncbi:TetR family transcriptional regulator [Mycobacterium avium subsp. hominissuis 101]|uniref:Transcriptional regulator, TetR family protein n=2 Tax=Mycobacterium avium TaxID=1764 RepID=A0A0H3A3M3_MYCA1|nr:transcriptional regulator, TetR family protein [Mycobacterium avium 104]KDP06919.1 TetR family transcriptional regulator [Mycobacterium avium subsp. hominissuis 101]